jgi:hypothetical protein
MPVEVELNGLLPGRGPGLGAPGRGPGVPPEAGGLVLAEPGADAAVSAAPPPGAAVPPGPGTLPGLVVGAGAGSGCENCTSGTPELAARPSPACSVSAAARPWAAGSAMPACTSLAAAAAGRTGACSGWLAAAAAMSAVAPLAARLPPWAAPPPAACAAAAWPANASFSRRTTGASMVDDAERTNSPISWSLAITALLSTPNSLASSYTRTFATTLPLFGPGECRASQPVRGVRLRPASVSAVHRRVLIERSSQSQPVFPAPHVPLAHPARRTESNPACNAACSHRIPAGPSGGVRAATPQVCVRYLTSSPSASGPVTRSALGIARRRLARSTQSRLGCR